MLVPFVIMEIEVSKIVPTRTCSMEGKKLLFLWSLVTWWIKSP